MTTDRGKSPAFQFYPNDFLGDARQAAMSAQEAGVYIRLMCVEWNEQGKGIPDNAVKCANMGGVTENQMKKIWLTIRNCFRPHPDDAEMLIHPRLQKEREKQDSYRRRQSDKGKASAALKEANRTSTTVEPRLPSGSPPVATETPPAVNSSSSSSSSDFSQRRARAQGHTIIGRNDHLDHAACGPNLVWCVPAPVHRKFAEALAPKFSGDREAAKDSLQQWYPTVWEGLPAQTVIGDAFKFWQPRFDAAFANTEQPATASKLTSRLAQAMANIKASGE